MYQKQALMENVRNNPTIVFFIENLTDTALRNIWFYDYFLLLTNPGYYNSQNGVAYLSCMPSMSHSRLCHLIAHHPNGFRICAISIYRYEVTTDTPSAPLKPLEKQVAIHHYDCFGSTASFPVIIEADAEFILDLNGTGNKSEETLDQIKRANNFGCADLGPMQIIGPRSALRLTNLAPREKLSITLYGVNPSYLMSQ